MASQTAGSATLSANDTIIFQDTRGCTAFYVHCLSGSTQRALVHVPGLHDAGDYLPIEKGLEAVFRLNHMGIKKVIAKGDGGAASINFGVLSNTVSEG